MIVEHIDKGKKYRIMVLAIMKRKRWRKDEISYLAVLPSQGFANWHDHAKFTLIDDSIPGWWMADEHPKNVCIDPYDLCSGDASVCYMSFQGPPLLVLDKQKLVTVSNSDGELTEALQEIFYKEENTDIFEPVLIEDTKG